MDSPTAILLSILQDRVHLLRDSGNLTEALHAATAVVEKSQQALSSDLDRIDAFATALEIRGDIHRELSHYEAALEDYRQAVDQLQDRPDRHAQIGRIHAGLGAAHDGMEDEESASSHWETAIAFYERSEPPLLLDIATLANNLGFISKSQGNFDAAETYFLRALEILHSSHGQSHEQTASVSSNLGALYHAAGYFEQSREMHMMSLETRRNLLGEEHPDTAQSHNNLALALLKTGDRSWARRHLEKALTGYEVLGAAYAADLEAVAENYCDFLREEGDTTLADVIASRVKIALGSDG
jgi:tetratricopeptide (TPR) repeat protein